MDYKALWIQEDADGNFLRSIATLSSEDLPAGDVTIAVHYSSLNYKDALSINGHKGITKSFPHQPGIDAAGIVVESSSSNFSIGDKVICCGYDLGMNTFGGFGELIRVPHEWVIHLPDEMTMEESMIYGTAGFTAALGVHLLERNGQKTDQGPIVVTGATGGVGSMAVGILAKAGYEVIASTGKSADDFAFLYDLGANQVVGRDFVDIPSDKLLMKSKWAGAIDTVGGNTLHTLLKACMPYGNIACCGLVQSDKLDLSIYPFIINGISLLGIATAENPIETKREIWNTLAKDWCINGLHDYKTAISLKEISDYVDAMMQGKTKGRIIVKHHR